MQLLKLQIKDAHQTLESTVEDIKSEQLHQDPGGKALPLGAAYAHLVFSEDKIVNGMIQQKPSLSETTYKEKTGASAPMPAMDEKWSVNHEDWANTVQIDLPKLKEYAQAVYAQTDAYLGSLTDADLDREIDLGPWGKKTIAYLIYGLVIGHANSLAGEISAVKGVFGEKGYPF